ncbi:MAG TPA: hypothetical protein PK358_07300 [Spirochaetota bacterium]|nr:hypothetical protein [Spirochaetota bacterium]HPJ34626.1 hypothetical protein [Spirochaetota bacterium]
MHTIKEELKKISHFLLMLVLLYAVNLGFNMLYDWGGVSVIVRVYIMVLSCYIIYNFSQLDADELREVYRERYGRRGTIYLFIVTRIFPFLFIYLMTVIFTLINYVQNSHWPYEPLVRLLDGRYSNTVIYALILFVVLRLKIRPGISIPVFIAAAFVYFYLDRLLYSIFEPGAGVSVIKATKFAGFYFILMYGYSKRRFKLFQSAFAGAFSGIFTFASLVLALFLVFSFSSPQGKVYSMTAKNLLKYGFYQVYQQFEFSVSEYSKTNDVTDLILFAERGKKEINFSAAKWEEFILDSGMSDADYIFRYLNSEKIILDFSRISQYAVAQSVKNPDNFLKAVHFKEYFSLYYHAKSDDFFLFYENGDSTVKKWIIDILAYTGDYDSISFLVDRLTDIDRKISESAYNSLKEISGLDPAGDGNRDIHDLEVVNIFRDYTAKFKRQ